MESRRAVRVISQFEFEGEHGGSQSRYLDRQPGYVALCFLIVADRHAFPLEAVALTLVSVCRELRVDDCLYLVKGRSAVECMAILVCASLCRCIKTEEKHPCVAPCSLQAVLPYGCAKYLFHIVI